MTKVLPRIDGDTEKLSNSVDDNSSDILSALLDVIEISFKLDVQVFEFSVI